MNIWQKLQKMRVDLQTMNIKKSGENKFAGYKYYELGDFVPSINQMMLDNGVCSIITYGEDMAYLTLINSENPEEKITFTSPMKDATLKGAHPIQNLGAVETYQRRYLYMTAFEIVEADVLDATQGKDDQPQNKRQGSKQNDRPGNKQRNKSQLSDAASSDLNTRILAIKKLTGRTTSDIMAELEERTGISSKDITDSNAAMCVKMLDEIYMENIKEGA